MKMFLVLQKQTLTSFLKKDHMNTVSEFQKHFAATIVPKHNGEYS